MDDGALLRNDSDAVAVISAAAAKRDRLRVERRQEKDGERQQQLGGLGHERESHGPVHCRVRAGSMVLP